MFDFWDMSWLVNEWALDSMLTKNWKHAFKKYWYTVRYCGIDAQSYWEREKQNKMALEWNYIVYFSKK